MKDRPKVYYIRAEDPERAIDDPGLAALAAAGWTIGAFSPVSKEGKDGAEAALMLVLWPPPSAKYSVFSFQNAVLVVVLTMVFSAFTGLIGAITSQVVLQILP